MDILPFVKPLNFILTELFVLIKQNWDFKRKYDYNQFKYKIISNLDCCLFAAKFCVDFFYCMSSSSYSQKDWSFWEFWKIIIVTWILER